MQQFHWIEMRQQGWLQENGNMFFRWKCVIVSELYLAVKIVAAAFFIEMNDIEVLLKLSGVHVAVRMVLAVFAKARSIAETAQKMMVFGAIVEIHVPTYRNEEHQKCHQWGYYLQNAFFHAANIVNLFDCDVITFFQLFDGSVEIAFQLFHFASAVNLKFLLSLFDGLLVRNRSRTLQ